jgi:hypothetical protein
VGDGAALEMRRPRVGAAICPAIGQVMDALIDSGIFPETRGR